MARRATTEDREWAPCLRATAAARAPKEAIESASGAAGTACSALAGRARVPQCSAVLSEPMEPMSAGPWTALVANAGLGAAASASRLSIELCLA